MPARRTALAAAALAALLACAAPASAPAATVRDVDLPELFGEQILDVKEKTSVPVLLPQRLRSGFSHHFPESSARLGRWTLDIGAVRDCHTATACFIAEFSARRGVRPSNPRKVKLARGRHGHFQPLSCGASCSPPSIEWRERHALYSIQAKLSGPRSDRRQLRRMANSAIRHGPR
jgi:hypothetical protein